MRNIRSTLVISLCLGMATAGCATQSDYEGEDLLITSVDLKKIPDGIPSNANTFFAGKPGHTLAFHKGPLTESGTFYFYDDTDHQIVSTQHMSPDQQAMQQPPQLNMAHEYRGFFLPDALGRVE